MPIIKVDLPQHVYERLVHEAVRQCRSIPGEAEIRLMRSLRVPLMSGERRGVEQLWYIAEWLSALAHLAREVVRPKS